MNRRWFDGSILIIMVICVVSCSANLEVRKQQGEAARNLGEAYYRNGNYTAALREFLKAEALYPDDPFLQNDLGLAYKAKRQLDLAIQHFERALEIKPDYPPAKNNLGAVYLDKQEWDTAIEYFKKVEKNLLYATPHLPLANLGWAYYNKKEYSIAERYYLEALDLEPRFVNAMRGLGLIYMATGRIEEAIKILERAVNEYPDYAQLYFDLGKIYTLSHDEEKALRAYQKINELAPNSALARDAEKAALRIKILKR